MLASILLATIAIVPILQVALDAPATLSSFYKILEANNNGSNENIEAIRGALIGIVINIITAIFIVAYMYFRVQTTAWKYSVERQKYMEDPEQYASDEDSQLKKGLPFLASFCANYTPRSLFHESKVRRREVGALLLDRSNNTSLIFAGNKKKNLLLLDSRSYDHDRSWNQCFHSHHHKSNEHGKASVVISSCCLSLTN